MSDYFDAQSNRVARAVTARSNDVNVLRDDVGSAFDLFPSLTNLTNDTTSYGTVSGTANAILVAMPETITSYDDGLKVTFKAASNNTGAATLNVDSVGVKDLVDKDGSALVADSLTADYIYSVRYNSTSDKFELQGVTVATLNAKVTAAEAAQTAAETAQTGAETAQTGAETAETGALAAQTAAETAQTGAEAAETGAETAQTGAETAETNSGLNVTYSEEWANKAEDSLVSAAAGGNEVDEYSAKHWAAKASGIAAGAIFTITVTAVNATAANGQHVIVTAAGKTITLPLSPSNGNRIRITVGSFKDTIIGRNSETIMGQAEDRIINKENATIELVYANGDWEVM